MKIWCCGCNKTIVARLTNGMEVYPNIFILRDVNIWKCDTCGNYVGCHQKGDSTKPMGSIPTPGIRKERMVIHNMIDPVWKNNLMSRSEIYTKISNVLGYKYHTANIKSIEEANTVKSIIKSIIAEVVHNEGIHNYK